MTDRLRPQEFLEQVNTSQFQDDVRKYQSNLKSSGNASNDRADIKHPTGDSDMKLVIKSALNCPSINPLNVPYSLLHKPKDSF